MLIKRKTLIFFSLYAKLASSIYSKDSRGSVYFAKPATTAGGKHLGPQPWLVIFHHSAEKAFTSLHVVVASGVKTRMHEG